MIMANSPSIQRALQSLPVAYTVRPEGLEIPDSTKNTRTITMNREVVDVYAFGDETLVIYLQSHPELGTVWHMPLADTLNALWLMGRSNHYHTPRHTWKTASRRSFSPFQLYRLARS